MSFMKTFAAPPIFARRACIRPMGPEPMTSTVSPGPMAQRWNALYTHESGSTTAAAAKSTPAGISLRLPCRTAAAGNEQVLGEPAVDVDAEGPVVGAELRVAAHALVADAAAHVGGHGDAHALPGSR